MDTNQTEQPQEVEQLKTVWRAESFIGHLEQAVRYHPISKEDLPDQIELESSTIAEAADQILKETLEDPQKRERSVGGKVNTLGKMLIEKIPRVGDESKVETIFNLNTRRDPENGIYSKKEGSVFSMHTHGIADTPASPQDFAGLMCNVDSGVQAEMVLTKSTKMIFIRTLQTGEIDSEDELRWIITGYSENMYEEFISTKKNERTGESMAWSAQNIKTVLEICRDYNIGAYISTEGHVYSRVNV